MQEEWRNLELALAQLRAAIAVELPKLAFEPNPDQAAAHLRLAAWAVEVSAEQRHAAERSLDLPAH
jgi:hypothetical protein